MSVPRNFLADLGTRVNIVDVVGRYVDLKKTGHDYSGLCPFHEEKTPSFTVSERKRFFHCFGCGAHGDAITFLMDHKGVPFMDAVRELAQGAGMKVPDERPPDDGRRRDLLDPRIGLRLAASELFFAATLISVCSRHDLTPARRTRLAEAAGSIRKTLRACGIRELQA